MNLEKNIKIISIFLAFLKIGSTSFGPTTMFEIKNNIVNKSKWLDEEDFLEGLAISQILPGPTFVILSVFIGYKLKRVLGCAASFLGFILPSFVIMTFLSWLYFKYQNIIFVHTLFKGLNAIVVALILNALIEMAKIALDSKLSIIIIIFSMIMTLIYNNVFIIFLGSALLGILLFKKNPIVKLDFDDITSTNNNSLKDVIIVSFVIVIFFIVVLQNNILFTLAIVFFKIGALVFGNGFTMLPLIQEEVIYTHRWLNLTDFLAGLSLGQITPGPITITATFIGYKIKGILGATVATLAIFSPSILLVVITSQLYEKIKNNKYINLSIKGINSSFIALMFFILVSTGKNALVDIKTILISIASFVAIKYSNLETLWVVLGGSIIYLLLNFVC